MTIAIVLTASPCTVAITSSYTASRTNMKGRQVLTRGRTVVGQGEGNRLASFPPLLHFPDASASIPVILVVPTVNFNILLYACAGLPGDRD
jgi:hypothetical protein